MNAIEKWVAMATRPSEILIIEDDEAFAELLLRVMAQYNCKPTLCRTAEEAFKFIDNDTRYDLIILDYVLPGSSGLEVLRRLSQSPTPDIPVAILSGHLTTDIVREVSELGLVAFFYKPVSSTLVALDRLMRTIGVKPKA